MKNPLLLLLYVIIAIGTPLIILQGQWRNPVVWLGYAALAIPLAARFFHMPGWFATLVVFGSFLEIIIGNVFGAYRLAGFDLIMHAFAGFLLAVLFLQFTKNATLPRTLLLPLVVFTSLGVGAAFEVFEFMSDTMLQTQLQHSLQNTMLDLVADGAGAFIGALFLIYAKFKPRNP